jgi:hypothetical protein
MVEDIKSEEIKNEEKKLSIGDILANADKIKNSTRAVETVTLKIDRLSQLSGSGVIMAKVPDTELIMRSIEKGKIGTGRKFTYQGVDVDLDYLASNCIVEPDFGSKELMDGLGLKKNLDVFKVVFKETELIEVIKILIEKMEGGVHIVEKVKN